MLEILGKCRNIGVTKTTIYILLFLTYVLPAKAQVVRDVIPGAERFDLYLPSLQAKNVALVGNHTSQVNGVHLLDTLISQGVNIAKIFSPEHGFRGKADAGATIGNDVDIKTGIPIVSLYGDHKEPRNDDLDGIELVVFDMQDVGVRFYTYISTLTYVLKACAENDVEVIVLDRPNPNAHYIDGPVLENRFKSFVGMHQVPVIYGMTIGEYGRMVVGENWNSSGKCKLRVIPIKDYDHSTYYELPVKPSPNLPNMTSILLYPSLCFFEGTVVSIGRGTDKPFQIIGHPDYVKGKYSFTPQPGEGSSKPKLMDRTCAGVDLSSSSIDSLRDNAQLDLTYLVDFYNELPNKKEFFINYFNLLAGNSALKEQIQNGVSIKEIKRSWAFDLENFKRIREKYLLYEDFESTIELK